MTSYSAPPRRNGAVTSSSTSFGPSSSAAFDSSTSTSSTFSSFGRPPRGDSGAGGGAGGYGCSGGSGGSSGGVSSRNEFDTAASAAFGKKPARTFEESPKNATVPKVTPARNTLASILDDLLPPTSEPKEREWTRSALSQQRKAAAAEKAAKPVPKKSYEEEFPTLGGGSVSVRIPKPVFTIPESDATKPAGSFANLAENWAKSEEERLSAEAHAAHVRFEQQKSDEFDHSRRTRLYFNRDTVSNWDSGHSNSNGHSNNYGGDNQYDEDEYIEGELGEEVYTEKDRRANLRVAANHYSDEDEEDEDRANYSIGKQW